MNCYPKEKTHWLLGGSFLNLFDDIFINIYINVILL